MAALTHIRRNAVAYLALFISLGGTSYAAIRISNHTITPVKLNQKFLGGYVREWASVAADGRLLASTDRPAVRVQVGVPGDYFVTWPTKPTTRCVATVNVDARGVDGGIPVAGYAVTEAARRPRRDEQTIVQTYTAAGQAEALPFDVALLCSTPH